MSGRVTVYTLPAEINWAANEVLAPGVHSVAALPDYPEAHHRMTDDGHRLFDAAINWALTYQVIGEPSGR